MRAGSEIGKTFSPGKNLGLQLKVQINFVIYKGNLQKINSTFDLNSAARYTLQLLTLSCYCDTFI